MKKRKLKKLLNDALDENNALYKILGDLKFELHVLKEQNSKGLAEVLRMRDEVNSYVRSKG